jgi:hypothetical protein
MNETYAENDFCSKFTLFYNNYIEKSIGAISFILNSTCMIVFIKIVRNTPKEDIYRYLLFKSIIDILISLRITFKSVIDCKKCESEKSYSLKVFYLIFFIYIEYAAELVTILCQILASFNRYRVISQAFNFFDKFSYKIAIVAITEFCLLFYVYLFVEYKIIEKTDQNGTTIAYIIQDGYLGTTGIALGYVHSVMRNVICVLIVFILNISTLYFVIKALRKKKYLVKETNKVQNKKTLTKTEKVELRLTLMIMVTSLVMFIAYGMSFIKWLKIENVSTNKCFITFNYMIYWLSFVFYFFIYLYFNLKFQKIVFFLN